MASRAEPAAPPSAVDLHSPLASNFSLCQGGFFYTLQRRLSPNEKTRSRVLRRAVFAALMAWLPLLAFSAAEGMAYGDKVRVPFLRDFAANARFLIALPVFILAERSIDVRLRTMVTHFLASRLVTSRELPSFEAVIKKVTGIRDRILPEVILILLAVLPSVSGRGIQLMSSSITTWHMRPGAGEGLSLAGLWFAWFSIPIVRFLLFRWLWRIILWSYFLWRVSRLDLHLVPTHADLAGGLGFLAEGQRRFAPIAFAGGCVIAAQLANLVAYAGATVAGLKYVMIGYCAFAMLMLTAPLLVVAPTLTRIKKQGLREYGALDAGYGQNFAEKWIHGKPPEGETLLGSSDIQSLADLGNSYGFVRDMRLVPVDKRALISLVLAAALPLLPLLIFATPADELMRTVFKMLM